MSPDSQSRSRRWLLRTLTTALSAGLAGCGANKNPRTPTRTVSETATASSTETPPTTPWPTDSPTDTLVPSPEPEPQSPEIAGDTEVEWSRIFDGRIHTDGVAVEKSSVVVSAGSAVVRLDTDGTTVWRRSFKNVAAAPVVDEKTTYVGYDNGSFAALSTETGESHWHFTGPDSGTGPRRLFERAGTLYAFDDGATLSAFDTDTRQTERLGTISTSPSTEGLVGATLTDDTAFATTDAGVLGARRLSDGAVVWPEISLAMAAVTAPVVDDGTLYVGEQESLIAIDPATGERQWTAQDAPSPGCISSVVDDTLYGFGDDTLYAVGTDGTVQWSTQTDSRDGVATAVGTDRVFVATADHVTALDRATGDRRWQASFQADPEFADITGVRVGPDDSVLVTTPRGELFSLSA